MKSKFQKMTSVLADAKVGAAVDTAKRAHTEKTTFNALEMVQKLLDEGCAQDKAGELLRGTIKKVEIGTQSVGGMIDIKISQGAKPGRGGIFFEEEEASSYSRSRPSEGGMFKPMTTPKSAEQPAEARSDKLGWMTSYKDSRF